MSLRAFHLLFIALSIALAAFFAAWASNQYRAGGQGEYLAVAFASLAAGGAMAIYAMRFQRKMKRLSRRTP
jgi:hypothetical protein